jgi:hypothetical protein
MFISCIKNQTKMEASAGIPPVWTEEKEDRFIELWRETPCLYDISSKAYSNRCTKNRALEDIAENLSQTLNEATLLFSSMFINNHKKYVHYYACLYVNICVTRLCADWSVL